MNCYVRVMVLTLSLLLLRSKISNAQETPASDQPIIQPDEAISAFQVAPLTALSSVTFQYPSNQYPSNATRYAPDANQSFANTIKFDVGTNGAGFVGNGAITSADAPRLIPLAAPKSGMSQRARDLLPVAPLPVNVTAQAETPSPTETPKPPAATEDNTGNLAKAAQNPIANLISVPFQYNFNFGVSPFDQTQFVLNVQPVIPVSIAPGWLLVNRIITPIVNQPTIAINSPSAPGLPPNLDPGYTFGLGDINPQFFFVPKTKSNITWGIGPQFIFPTATTNVTGSGKWSIGPTGVIVYTRSKWVIGVLANQAWSFAGDRDRKAVSSFLLQPFINYNLPKGWYVTTGPQITANWMAEPGEQWTLPLGGGIGKLFKIGKQPLNASLQAYETSSRIRRSGTLEGVRMLIEP